TRAHQPPSPTVIPESLPHSCSRRAMNTKRLGDRLVDQLVAAGLLTDVASIYDLKAEGLAELERWGKKSASNLMAEIEKSKENDLSRLVFALGLGHAGEKA